MLPERTTPLDTAAGGRGRAHAKVVKHTSVNKEASSCWARKRDVLGAGTTNWHHARRMTTCEVATSISRPALAGKLFCICCTGSVDLPKPVTLEGSGAT